VFKYVVQNFHITRKVYAQKSVQITFKNKEGQKFVCLDVAQKIPFDFKKIVWLSALIHSHLLTPILFVKALATNNSSNLNKPIR
jgi:hypothetical protein